MNDRIAIAISVLLAVLAGSAPAQDNGLGVFFSDSEFTDAATNIDPGADPFQLYIVVLDCVYATVGGYECGIEFDGAQPAILGADGPTGSGWVNFGTNQNHRVVFTTPPAAVGGAVVLGIVTVRVTAPSLVEVRLGPAIPASIPDHPMVVNGADPDGLDLAACGLTSGDEIPGVVATINGGGITAVESRRLATIRDLFD